MKDKCCRNTFPKGMRWKWEWTEEGEINQRLYVLVIYYYFLYDMSCWGKCVRKSMVKVHQRTSKNVRKMREREGGREGERERARGRKERGEGKRKKMREGERERKEVREGEREE